MTAVTALIFIFRALLLFLCIYVGFLGLLTVPAIQSQAIYLHGVVLTWFQDVNFPVQWGFLPNQVTPFHLRTPDGEVLHAWHILPLGLYQRHQASLTAEPAGLAPNIADRFGFKLLRDDPESLLVLYLHGAAGTLGSGWRPPSYRAMHALAPERIHTVAVDYRGFGTSTGTPSEDGLLTDALTLAEWAMHEADIPPERIVVFAQSLGTAVAISLARHLATRAVEPVFFKGMVLVAPFANVAELTRTYRIAGIIPLLSPLARFPTLYAYFKSFLVCQWPSQDTLAKLLQSVQHTKGGRYDITIIHAQDDWDIPWSHGESLFWHAVEATVSEDENYNDTKGQMEARRVALDKNSWRLQRDTPHGVLRQEIMEYGLHDKIMSYPVVSSAVWRAFQGVN